jgi:hypothetical protein
MDQRVGEARAVHVQGQPVPAARGAERRDRVRVIDSAPLGGLRNADGLGLDMVDPAIDGAGDRGLDLRRRDAAIGRGQRQQLGAAHEKLRRAALVRGDMRLLVAQHRPIRVDQCRQRQRIGGGAGADRIDRQVSLKECGGARGQARGERIGAVGGDDAVVGCCHRLHDLRAHGRGVVAGEIHGASRIPSTSVMS